MQCTHSLNFPCILCRNSEENLILGKTQELSDGSAWYPLSGFYYLLEFTVILHFSIFLLTQSINLHCIMISISNIYIYIYYKLFCVYFVIVYHNQ